MTEQLGLRADVGAMYGKMPKKKKELDSLIFTYDINANTAFDIYNLPHKLELLNNFFHVVISR